MAYLAAVLKGEPEGEIPGAFRVLGVREVDGPLGGPVESGTNTADCGPEDDKPPCKRD